jgi:glutathione synthase/RimK-type ligase-like ATP-grasp enzyme
LYKVLIADYANSDITAEIPYLFKIAGCSADVFCFKESWLLKNSFYNKWHNPAREDYAKQLQELVKQNNYDWVVLADDATVRLMDAAVTDPVLAQKILPLSKLENRTMLGSKAGLSILCSKYNILTPPYKIYNGLAGLLELGAKISFPLVVKIDESGGGRGVFFCENQAILKASWEKIGSLEKNNLVLQKYIPGQNIAVEGLWKAGKLLAYVYSRVIGTEDSEFNASTKREYSECPDMEPLLEHMGRSLGLNGFANVTFIYNPAEKLYYLIEVDLRPQSWFRLAIFSGVDFSLAIQNYFSGEGNLIRPVLPPGIKVFIMRHFSRQICADIRHWDILDMLKWVVNRQGRWQFVPWYDKKLLRDIGLLFLKYAYARNVKRFFMVNYDRIK